MGTVIAGYSFGVNETPTFAKFQAQAMGLTVTDVSITEIAEVLIGQITGNDSNTTGGSLPATTGWQWCDPQGNIWVQTQRLDAAGVTVFQPCILHSVYGGWYTNRFVAGDIGAINAAMPVWAAGLTSTTETPDTFLGHFDADSTGGGNAGFMRDSPSASGAHFLLVGRGFVNAFLNREIEAEPAFGNQDYACWIDPTDTWIKTDDPQNAVSQAQYCGMVAWAGDVGFLSDETGTPGTWGDPHWTYFFGGSLFGSNT